MKDSTIITVFALGCVTAMAIAAVLKGVDTTVIASVCALIGSVIGYIYGKKG